jgi:CheY-like chemotaxis protein
MTPKLVLVVEDDPDLRETLIDALSSFGCTAAAACNGRDALDQLRAGARPQVILLDLMMPVMDGWEFRKQQLADPKLADIPVVALSAHEELKKFPAPVLLKKPLQLAELQRALSRFGAA